MFENFTSVARRAMANANREANRYGQKLILADHILLSVCLDEKSSAAGVLRARRVELASLRREAKAHLMSLGANDPCPEDLGRPVIEMTFEEANALKSPRIATHHLMLGVLRCPQSNAAKILSKWGVSLTDFRIDARDAELD